jgi:hypothetical protein
VLAYIRETVAGAVEYYADIKHCIMETSHHTSDREMVFDVHDRFYVLCTKKMPKFVKKNLQIHLNL